MIKHRDFLRDLQTSEQFYNDQESRQIIGELIAMIDEGYNMQPKTDWIPCEVELPKTNGVYQVIREMKEGEVTYHIPTASYFDGQNTWHNDICVNFGRQNEQNVIAWQPIQLYKKEGTENE